MSSRARRRPTWALVSPLLALLPLACVRLAPAEGEALAGAADAAPSGDDAGGADPPKRDAAIDVGATPRDAGVLPVIDTAAPRDTSGSDGVDVPPPRDSSVAVGMDATADAAPAIPIAQPGSGAPLAEACGGALSITEVALYQAVKITLAKDGGEMPRGVHVIEGRPALVRAFVAPRSPLGRGEATARLTVRAAGVAKTYDQRLTIAAASTDGDLASTFNFEVPGTDLAAGASYAVELRSAACDTAAAAPVARYPEAGEAGLTPVRTGVLRVLVVPIRYDTDLSRRLPDTSATQIKAFRDSLMAVYPVRDVEITVRAAVGTSQVVTAAAGWSELLESLRALRASDAPAGDLYYYGVITPAATGSQYCGSSCTAGIAYQNPINDPSTRVGAGIGYASTRAAEAIAHEIGHEHGRLHSPCGGVKDADPEFPYPGGLTGAWGYDARTKVLIDPAKTKDLMGYCDPRWISDHTYKAFTDRSLAINADAQRPLAFLDVGADAAATWRTLLLDADGTGRWGLGHEGPAFGTRRPATVLDARGDTIAEIEVRAIAMGDAGATTVFVPAPRAGWAAVRLDGASAPVPFAAPPAVAPLHP